MTVSWIITIIIWGFAIGFFWLDIIGYFNIYLAIFGIIFGTAVVIFSFLPNTGAYHGRNHSNHL